MVSPLVSLHLVISKKFHDYSACKMEKIPCKIQGLDGGLPATASQRLIVDPYRQFESFVRKLHGVVRNRFSLFKIIRGETITPSSRENP